MIFSGQQAAALAMIKFWARKTDAPQVFRLFGYAGTGKSTLAKHVAENVGNVAYADFTGKAAKVMRSKGCAEASTIHSLIYDSGRDPNTGLFKHWLSPSRVQDLDLIVIDECSMVGIKLGTDLLSFGKKVLVLGDPEQLPPVGDDTGFFTNCKPDMLLEEVHRQAAESDILRLATQIRKGHMPSKIGSYGDLNIIAKSALDDNRLSGAGALLVGRNDTRFSFNRRMRAMKGFQGDFPYKGESLICLRNDKIMGLSNGSMWNVHKLLKPKKAPAGSVIRMEIQDQDNDGVFLKVGCMEHFFQGQDRVRELDWKEKTGTQEFDYGYAVTVHKAQGSQWDDVLLVDESSAFRTDAHRWLYTGVTSAAKTLTLAI
jgi:exodeoxyribonuclease V